MNAPSRPGRAVLSRPGRAVLSRPGRAAMLLWAAAATAAEPLLRLLLRRRVRRGKELAHRLAERRGVEIAPRPSGQLFWFHAASVGESSSLLPVIDVLLRRQPELTILVTTATVTAQALLRRRLQPELASGRVRCRFVPLDVPRWTRRFLRHWRPDLAVFVESELWPNLLSATGRAGIPLALVNARLSARSAARWRLAGPLGRDLLRSFQLVAARSSEDAARLRALGVPGVVREGDLKRAADPLPFDPVELRRLLALLGSRPFWLAASTHPGEEEQLAATHRALLDHHPDLLTLVAPRHPERGAAVSALLDAAPRRSLGTDPDPSHGYWVLDTLGELGLFYRLAPIVLLGNSLDGARGRGGGHNPFEPARLDCALAIGPRVDNFRDDVFRLERRGAIAVLADAEARLSWLERMLAHPAERRASADRARHETVLDATLAERISERLLALPRADAPQPGAPQPGAGRPMPSAPC